MPEEKIPEEHLRKVAGFYLDLAQGNLEELKQSINVCDIIGAYPIFRDIHANSELARKYSNQLPDQEREKLNKSISFIEAESFEVVGGILTKCNCGTRIV